jgi:hypothetical protein
MILLIEVAVAIALVSALLIESSSWWIKALCPPQQMGAYISRTNIYLYGGRFFVLVFSSGVAFYVESGQSPGRVAVLVGLSMLLAAVAQAVLLNHSSLGHFVLRLAARSLFLKGEFPTNHRDLGLWSPLTVPTLWSSLAFGLGTGAPLLIAALLPDFRLSISYTGQIINSAGTLIILLYVDQRLYKAMDNGLLFSEMSGYTSGRVAGFAMAGLVFLVASPFVG